MFGNSLGKLSGNFFRNPLRHTIVAAALLVCPVGMFAQRGGAGRTLGGGSETVGGLNTVGRPSGVAEKDDLKDFHEALAVQATSQQVTEFAALQKSTASARAELQALLEAQNKQKSAAEVEGQGAAVARALEATRSGNKKFLDELSDRQKIGLKEMIKRVAKADSDLAQPAQELALELHSAKPLKPGEPILGSAQSLDRGLERLQHEQLDLGEEMGIGDPNSQAGTFKLPAVRNLVRLGDQSIAIPATGTVLQGAVSGGESSFSLELSADLSELQQNMTAVLRSQVDKADGCGEHISIESANIYPQMPASLAAVQLHYERWTCFGGAASEIVEGNGTIEVKLTPSVAEDGTLRLLAETRRVDAQGLVGDLLRSGSLGDGLRDRLTELLLSAIRVGGDFKTILPSAAQGSARLQRAQFEGIGANRLVVALEGEIRLSGAAAAALTEELKTNQSKLSELKSSQSQSGESQSGESKSGESKSGELKTHDSSGQTSVQQLVQPSVPR